LSTDGTGARIRIPGRLVSVRVARSAEADPAVAREQARLAEEEAFRTQLRQEAREEAFRETAERFQGALDTLGAELQRLREHQDDLLRNLEPHLVELSLAIAGKLVARGIEEGVLEIRPVVEAVLRELREPGAPSVLEVALGPEDYASLGGPDGHPTIEGVHVVTDSSLPRGTCVVLTDAGRIRSDLESRLLSIRRSLRDLIVVHS
jgi:flagellar biosynthesis/type III secretory pathway protein FliH